MGVPVTGTITTTGSGDTYATTDPLTGIDSWRAVADHTARNAIPALRRRQGMAVWTQSDSLLWTLNASPWAFDDTDWTQFTGAGLSVLTTLGDILYFSTVNARLAGNITTTKKYLSQTGAGASSAAPVWAQVAFADLSGSVAAAQLPNPSASTLGGVQSIAAVTDSFLTTISTSGVSALAVPRGPHQFTAVLGLGAAITTGTNSTGNYLVCPFAGTFTRWDMVCPTANQPSGASLVVDVQKSAAGAGSFATIFTNKPTITTGTNNGGGTVSDFSVTTFSAGDVLRFDVITAGGGAVQNVTLVISSRMAQ